MHGPAGTVCASQWSRHSGYGGAFAGTASAVANYIAVGQPAGVTNQKGVADIIVGNANHRSQHIAHLWQRGRGAGGVAERVSCRVGVDDAGVVDQREAHGQFALIFGVDYIDINVECSDCAGNTAAAQRGVVCELRRRGNSPAINAQRPARLYFHATFGKLRFIGTLILHSTFKLVVLLAIITNVVGGGAMIHRVNVNAVIVAWNDACSPREVQLKRAVAVGSSTPCAV